MGGIKLFVLLAIVQSSWGEDLPFKFATTPRYEDSILVLASSKGVLDSLLYPVSEEPLSTLTSRLSCFEKCMARTDCKALNLYSNATHHTCELLSDNLCLSPGSLALMTWPGAEAWDKVEYQTGEACIDQQFESLPESKWCDTVRPGCAGTWPDCNDCVQTCIDCQKRSNNTESYNCTLWPGGTATKPIFTSCMGNATILMGRAFFPTIESPPVDYRMSFRDMNRLIELKAYNALLFMFVTESLNETFTGIYKNPYIDVKGNLSRTTGPTDLDWYVDESGSRKTADSIPFVRVDDAIDTDSCGSFWRLDPNAPPHCPGGTVSIFGRLQRDAEGRVTHTGIRFPDAGNKTLSFGVVALYINK